MKEQSKSHQSLGRFTAERKGGIKSVCGSETHHSMTPSSSSMTSSDAPIHHVIKLMTNLCFSGFVLSVLIFTLLAITYHPPDPWLQSAPALTALFSRSLNATFHPDDSLLLTGDDFLLAPPLSLSPSPSPSPSPSLPLSDSLLPPINVSSCPDPPPTLNCSHPLTLLAVQSFNLRVFKSLSFFDYQPPFNTSKPDQCDVSWRFHNKKDKSWRKFRDFRRFTFAFTDNCAYEVINAGGWHSGTNARRFRPRITGDVPLRDEQINDTIPTLGSDANFRKRRYLYYSRGGDYCKGMNHYLWSFMCGLGEAMYLNRTFVMDFSVCMAATYNPSNKDEEGKDFRYYFDFEHLKGVVPVVEEGEFLRDWKRWDRGHKRKVPTRKVANHKVTPMMLRKDKSSIIWRQFDAPEPDNYWYRVCEGQAAKYVQRPWHAIWKSKRLMNIVSEISGQMDWDFDAVHVVRGEKARNTELWPHLEQDTAPESILEKLKGLVQPWRNLYVATNEPFYSYFDKLRSQYKIHLLDDYKHLWGNNSEWFNETMSLNNGRAVEFDGYMRVAVDTEVLYRAKTKVETFYNLTKDCKDGVNTC